MALLWTVLSVSTSLFLTPCLMLLLAIMFLASMGKSLGVRRLYVKTLLKIFEYGRESIEIAKRQNQNSEDSNSHEDAKQEQRLPLVNGNTKPLGNAHLNANKNQNGVLVNSSHVISHDLILQPDPEQNFNGVHEGDTDKSHLPRASSYNTLKHEFELSDCFDFVKAGVEAIIEDQVTSRFEAEELRSWNLLTRTNRRYEFISWRLTVIWMSGFIMRYFFLFPLRVIVCFFGCLWLVVGAVVVGNIPDGRIKRWLADKMVLTSFRIMSRSLSSVITFHNLQWKPKKCGLCVANHTSVLDVGILSTQTTFSLIGQRHGGFLGILQRALARASPHIWFERSEVKDRTAVAQRLRKHVSDPNNPPILIFPEGTCINNTSVMQFKKGSFDVKSVIYPVAIKYDPRFGDAFWNSSRYSMMQYLYMMMTSWAIVCDVWYLPPMSREEDESAVSFANRVKREIAKQGGLVDLMWDGQLKRSKPKPEWKERQQEEFSKRLKVE